MKQNSIYNYISYIHQRLTVWNHNMPACQHNRLQKIYEIFISELVDANKEWNKEQNLKKLKLSIIAIVAKDKDEQESLGQNYNQWNRHYFIDSKKKSFNYNQLFLFVALLLLSGLIYKVFLFDPTPATIIPEEITKPDLIHIAPITNRLFESNKIDLNFSSLIKFDSIRYYATENWVSKTKEIAKIDTLENGILIFDNTNISRIIYEPFFEGISYKTIELKSIVDTSNTIYKQCIELTILFKDSILETNLDTFPNILFQNYPYPDRTALQIYNEPPNTNTLIKLYKIPLSLLITLLLGLLFNYLKNRRKKYKTKSSSVARNTSRKRKHPYSWSITLPNRKCLDLPTLLDKSIHTLKSIAPSGRKLIDIPRTISKSIRNGGYINIKYNDHSIKTHLLFLINTHSKADHRASLWLEITKKLQAKDINTTTLYFNSDIRSCYNNTFPKGVSLKELYNIYTGSTLVIISDNYNLLNPSTGLLNKWTNIFENWDTRYLLTWKNYYSWNKKETILRGLFHVLPAKLNSLALLCDLPNSGTPHKYVANFEDHIVDYQIEFTESDIDISFTAVQKEWIAACCLFKNLHYDLSIAIGEIVYAHHEKVLTTEDIEEVFNLPWFVEGGIPQGIRSKLAIQLEQQSLSLTEKVRKYISTELVHHAPPVGSHAADWFDESILVNDLLNKSNNHTSNRIYEITKRLERIHSRGVLPDLQYTQHTTKQSKFLNRIKNRVRIFSAKNIYKLASLLPLFLLVFAIARDTLPDKICLSTKKIESFVPINKDLSKKYYEDTEGRNEVIKKYKNTKTDICTESYRYYENIIEENYLRRDIFLSNEITEKLINKITKSDNSDIGFSQNIAIDLFNYSLTKVDTLRGKSMLQIKSDTNLLSIANQFCKILRLSEDIGHRGGHLENSEVDDSLHLFGHWCTLLDSMIIDTIILDSCETITCHNGGICIKGKCKCPDGFFGRYCDIRKSENPCDTIKCQNEGTCISGKCKCLEGYYGVYCQLKKKLLPKLKITSYNYDATKLKNITAQIPSKNYEVTKINATRPTLIDQRPATLHHTKTNRSKAAQLAANINNKTGIKIALQEKSPRSQMYNGNDLELILINSQCAICQRKSIDKTGPTISKIPKSIYKQVKNNSCSTKAIWNSPSVSDNCSVLNMTSTHKSGDIFKKGKTTVIYTATDVCGNSNSVSFIVTVECNKENTKILKGKVLSTSKETPLIGASVVIRGTTLGTITDINGEFTLALKGDYRDIVVSYAGLVSKTIDIQNIWNSNGQQVKDLSIKLDKKESPNSTDQEYALWVGDKYDSYRSTIDKYDIIVEQYTNTKQLYNLSRYEDIIVYISSKKSIAQYQELAKYYKSMKRPPNINIVFNNEKEKKSLLPQLKLTGKEEVIIEREFKKTLNSESYIKQRNKK